MNKSEKRSVELPINEWLNVVEAIRNQCIELAYYARQVPDPDDDGADLHAAKIEIESLTQAKMRIEECIKERQQ